MSSSIRPYKTVLQTILEWSSSRPLWQRDALRRLVQDEKLSDKDIAELVSLCKSSKASSASATAQPLERKHLPANPGAGASVSLLSIADVEGVNILAPKQTLSFAPTGLTILYGDNGAGKSGYARILKRACRARAREQIHPDISASQPPAPSATITYGINGNPRPSERWADADHPHEELSAVSVFDSACASIYIEKENDVAFRPFGLDVPDKLVAACHRVKAKLVDEQEAVERRQDALFRNPPWNPTTTVGRAMAALKHDSDVARLSALATLSEEERARLSQLKEDLAKDPAKAAAAQRLRADNVKNVLATLARVEATTGDDVLLPALSLAQVATASRAAAQLAADNAFSGEALESVGGDAWRRLWEAARRYSVEAAYPDQPFPAARADDLCVLCHQPLHPDARKRMSRFEEFVQMDTERRAQADERSAGEARRRVEGATLDTRSMKSSLQDLSLTDNALARDVRRFVASARLRRYAALRALDGHDEHQPLPPFSASPKDRLVSLESSMRGHANQLHAAATEAGRITLEAEFSELSDRASLHANLETVLAEIERLKQRHFFGQCVADTTTDGITRLATAIADDVLTPQLRDRFHDEIVKLVESKVRVELVRSSSEYGSPQYEIRMLANPGTKVKTVLSEGEKTCVALAAFLTELATAAHQSTLVFDDPVSSLDHRWRDAVATRLVAEAAVRQVIVFTHDLIFTTDLYDKAKQSGQQIQPRCVTVVRAQDGAGVVRDGLPWDGKGVEDRIDKLEKRARTARKLYETNQDTEYRRAARDIYNDLRATWERAIERIAFLGIVVRHRDYINHKSLEKVTALDKTDCEALTLAWDKCCGIVSGHDPSAGRNASPPRPAEMLQDIQALRAWTDSLRARQALIKTT